MVINTEHVAKRDNVMIETASPKRNKPFVASYARIADGLRAKVQEGGLTAGQVLPGMRRLAKDYGVAVGTVQQAISTLVEEGVLISDGWRGTYVADLANEPASGAGDTGLSASGSLVEDLAGRKTIGIVTDVPPEIRMAPRDIANLFSVAIVHAMERELSIKQNVFVRIVNVFGPDGKRMAPSAIVRSLLDQEVDGIVAVRWADGADDAEVLDAIGSVPYVVASTSGGVHAVPFVAYDNLSARYDATAHLLTGGWRPLTFLAPFTGSCSWQEGRIAGAYEALRRFRLPRETMHLYHGAVACDLLSLNQAEAGFEMCCSLFSEGVLEGRGVIAVNDHVALGFLAAAQERGLVAGRDFALIGFDNTYSSLESGLTSLAAPLQAIGEQAARLLVKELRGARTLSQIWLRSHLIPRSSTR